MLKSTARRALAAYVKIPTLSALRFARRCWNKLGRTDWTDHDAISLLHISAESSIASVLAALVPRVTLQCAELRPPDVRAVVLHMFFRVLEFADGASTLPPTVHVPFLFARHRLKIRCFNT